MKRIVFLPILLILSFVVASCGRYSAGREQLRDIASYADASPDSARVSLERMNRRLLVTRSLRARHALLYSQAMDRTNNLITDDSIATVAVNYYQRFGKPQDRFVALYYRGRVYENAKDYSSAIQDYITAEAIKSDKVSPRYRASAAIHCYHLYFNQEDLVHAEKSALEAIKYTKEANRTSNYVASLMNLAKVSAVDNQIARADSCRQEIEPLMEQLSLPIWLAVKEFDILRQVLYGDTDYDLLTNAVNDILERCRIDSTMIPWNSLSLAYQKMGDNELALTALENYDRYQPNDYQHSLKYYANLSSLLDSLGRDTDSKVAYRQYIALSDSAHTSMLSQQVSTLEERHQEQVKAIRLRQSAAILCLITLSIICIGVPTLYRRKKRHTQLLAMYDNLQAELSSLKEIQSNQEDMSKEAVSILGQRITALSRFLSNETPESLEQVSSQLETLTENRRELLDTIGMLYAVYHPNFVSQLAGYGLSSTEVGYCCLLVLGVRSGEIGDIINRSGVYNIASGIKSKFGDLAEGQHLATIVKKIYSES